MKKTKLKQLLEETVSIEEETTFGNYIYKWITDLNKFDVIKKDYLTKSRFNIYATKGTPKVIFCCHLDTVTKHNNQLQGWKKDKFYGLGSKDMKGGIVALLTALQSCEFLADVGVIFYVGEETDQIGIESVIKKWKYNPKLVICPESRFVIGNGGRGLLLFQADVIGKKAHSARPHLGINAISSGYDFVNFCNKRLLKMKSPVFQNAVMTILSVKSEPEDSLEGIIPDRCRLNLEVRTTSNKITFDWLQSLGQQFNDLQKGEVKMTLIKEYPATYIDPKRTKLLENSIKEAGFKPEYSDVKLAGFNDVFMLFHKYQVPVVNFGPYGEDNHTANEWVSFKSIAATANVYLKVLNDLLPIENKMTKGDNFNL